MTARPKVTFCTREYRFAHGRLPRGRGGWLFRIPGISELHSFAGTYSEARQSAKVAAYRLGQAQGLSAVCVEVCS